MYDVCAVCSTPLKLALRHCTANIVAHGSKQQHATFVLPVLWADARAQTGKVLIFIVQWFVLPWLFCPEQQTTKHKLSYA